jgi:putative glutathione S-transferase
VTTTTARYASPVDTDRYGAYRISRPPDDSRPLYRFTERISADGSTGFGAEPGRYHLYGGWFCPWSQRVSIQVALNGLSDVIGVSYVDDARDGRGWAFRELHGPDPVNGFELLRDAYEATEPGFDGHISTPTLWDRGTGDEQPARVLSNNFATIGLDIATQFTQWADPAVNTYPEPLRAEIDDLDRWLGPAVNRGVSVAAGDGPDSAAARTELLDAFQTLDDRLAGQRFLLGSSITEADIRLFVTLVRYDVQANAPRQINAGLDEFPNLWGYARDLYAHAAFSGTTDFSTFAAPGATVPDWSEPTDRARLGADPAEHTDDTEQGSQA